MTMISAVKTYLSNYSGLKSGKPLLTDFLGSKPNQYSIVSIAGAQVLQSYINGGSQRQYLFAVQATFSTADEAERLEASGFFEGLSDWFESQTEDNDFPTLNTGKTPERIEALGWGYLYEQGGSSNGVYQIQCRLVYQQDPLSTEE